jgi:DNA-binding NarL/FixJ family response regulator
MSGTIRVLIIHRNCLFREGLAFVLAQQPNIAVVGSVAEASAVLGELEKLRPDVIILDLYLPGREGVEKAQRIRAVFPDAKIVIIGLDKEESDVLACIEAGGAGCLPQEASVEELLNNIQAVAAGEALCSPKVAGLLFSRIREAGRERDLRQVSGLPELTRREDEIMRLIAEGLSNKEIAVRLQIEVQTVKNHVHNILDKLQLDDRRAAARYARERGLL